MKKTLFLSLFILTTFLLNAQDNSERVNTMITMAMTKATNGGTMEEINELFNQINTAYSDYPETYTAWGTCILICAKEDYKTYEDAFDKFRKATEIKPDNAMAYYLWGRSKYYYAKNKRDDSLYKESFSLYQKAVDIDPQFTEAYYLWGINLLECAKTENSVQLYKESIDKFEKIISITPKNANAWEYKAWAYFRIGKLENNLVKYKDQIVDSYTEAERNGSRLAAYNITCYYSLIKEKDLALKWFEKMLVKSNVDNVGLTKERIDNDKDFDNIRNEKKYKELMKRFFQD